MTTTDPGRRGDKPRRVGRSTSQPVDDDPTNYPDWEPVGRDPTESDIVLDLQPVVKRHQAERGIECYVGTDNFIYWIKGNNTMSVSPDVYTLPGISPKANPKRLAGSKDEGCWKTWLLGGIVPNFALEVKAFKNPRKDELQSIDRHDDLGTKELVVFDPYIKRRRHPRRTRFSVYRRNTAGRLTLVVETNGDRVFSEELDAFLVAQGDDDEARLHLGLGPNGNDLRPCEPERADMEARRADEEARRADEEARRADEQTRRVDELEAELARLRASLDNRPTGR